MAFRVSKGFEEIEGAVDVRRDEIAGAGDAAIHVAFGREVHDMGDLMLADDAKNAVLVTQIDLLEGIAWMHAVDAIEVFEMPGIGEAVEIDQLGDFRLVDDMPDEVRADKTGTACDEKVHALTAVYSLNQPRTGLRAAFSKPAAFRAARTDSGRTQESMVSQK